MLINKKKAYINQKCDECGELIYPEDAVIVEPDKAKDRNPSAHWKLCEECFEKLFKKIKNEKK